MCKVCIIWGLEQLLLWWSRGPGDGVVAYSYKDVLAGSGLANCCSLPRPYSFSNSATWSRSWLGTRNGSSGFRKGLQKPNTVSVIGDPLPRDPSVQRCHLQRWVFREVWLHLRRQRHMRQHKSTAWQLQGEHGKHVRVSPITCPSTAEQMSHPSIFMFLLVTSARHIILRRETKLFALEKNVLPLTP